MKSLKIKRNTTSILKFPFTKATPFNAIHFTKSLTPRYKQKKNC